LGAAHTGPVLLATGARALAVAGRWEDAYARLCGYQGIGRRMLDGRQVVVIAHAASGDTDGALALLGATGSVEDPHARQIATDLIDRTTALAKAEEVMARDDRESSTLDRWAGRSKRALIHENASTTEE